jgi:hypothetical protein
LGRTPIICPVCQAAYQVAPPSTRRERAAAAAEPRPKPAPELEPVALEPDTISLEEVEEGSDDVAIEAEIVDLGEDEDVFLEDDEEDEGNVTGFIGGDSDDEER